MTGCYLLTHFRYSPWDDKVCGSMIVKKKKMKTEVDIYLLATQYSTLPSYSDKGPASIRSWDGYMPTTFLLIPESTFIDFAWYSACSEQRFLKLINLLVRLHAHIEKLHRQHWTKVHRWEKCFSTLTSLSSSMDLF